MADNKVVNDHLNKAEGYLMLGMNEDALHEATAAHAIDADSYRANVLKGITLIALERYAEAGEALARAIALNPNEAEGYIHLAYVHRRTVSLDQAIETILKAVELEPQMPLASYNLACYYALKGETDDALRFLGRAINLAPNFREAARADEDFSSLHTNDRFRRLVEME
jgi:Flp pilus assembly protein TadD